jgi:hypothetical protein
MIDIDMRIFYMDHIYIYIYIYIYKGEWLRKNLNIIQLY